MNIQDKKKADVIRLLKSIESGDPKGISVVNEKI
jgi:hypothetical protein